MQPGWKVINGRAEHIKSHQLDLQPDLIHTITDPDLKHKLLGNKLADLRADDGQTMHEGLHKELMMIDHMAHRTARAVVALAARILPLHPKRARHQRAAPPPPPTSPPHSDDADLADARAHGPGVRVRPASSVEHFLHVWVPIAATPGTWRCKGCGLVANTGQLDPPSTRGCRGSSVVLSRVGRGHRLVRYSLPPHPDNPEQTPFFACEECHRCASTKPVFEEVCVGNPTAARSRGYHRLEAGKHPHHRWGSAILFSEGQWFLYQVTEEENSSS